ncbi:MAG: ParB/RepB/Spo0J family partition protein [Elusimicrobiota bacterium]
MQRGLGKGLSALIPTIAIDATREPSGKTGEEIRKLPVDKIKPNKYQARKKFDRAKLEELAHSIKEKGIIQPLLVTPSVIPGEYELIAGERRLRAAKIAGVTEIPSIIRQATDKDRYQISLIENLQREDLDPIEEAKAYRGVLDEFSITQEELASLVGKDRAVVTNTLRLLSLPETVQNMISEGMISPGHGRSIAVITDGQKQREIVDRIQREKLTVRETEKIVHDWKSVLGGKRALPGRKKAPEILAMENTLQKLLGTKVQVYAARGGRKGRIVIHFYSLDDLDRLVKHFKKK